MDFITKEKFEAFVQKEFPGKEFHWDYNDGRGYMSIQAGNGKKFSFPDIHYEYYNGQVRVHIEGEHWWWLRHELSYILKRHDELRGEVSCFPRWVTHVFCPHSGTASLHSSDCSSSMPRYALLTCLERGSA